MCKICNFWAKIQKNRLEKRITRNKNGKPNKTRSASYMYHDAFIPANNNVLCYSVHDCANSATYSQLKSLQQNKFNYRNKDNINRTKQ